MCRTTTPLPIEADTTVRAQRQLYAVNGGEPARTKGIATALGLNSIAGPWIESIHRPGRDPWPTDTKSIAGQDQRELKKPENRETAAIR